MSTFFGLFAQFIYEHMTIYRNLTPNITKGQGRIKKGPKQVKKGQKKGQKGAKRGKNTRYLEKYDITPFLWHI